MLATCHWSILLPNEQVFCDLCHLFLQNEHVDMVLLLDVISSNESKVFILRLFLLRGRTGYISPLVVCGTLEL